MKMLRAGVVLVGLLVAAPTARPGSSVLGSTSVSWEEVQAKEATGTGAAYRQVFRSPTATLDELELHVTTLPPGQEPHPPHKHADEEIIIIKEGTVEATANGVTHRLGPGSVIFQASNQMHGLRNVGDTPAVYHVIKWNSPGMLSERKP
jgi:quercetin dioxygenase-like cupin family protein